MNVPFRTSDPVPGAVRLCGLLQLALVATLGLQADGHASPLRDTELKAAYILNFARLSRWADFAGEAVPSSLTICTLNDSPLSRDLRRIAESKVVSGRIVTVTVTKAPTPSRCRVLVIQDGDGAEAQRALRAVRQSAVLTVSDGLNDGGGGVMLRLVEEGDRILFDTNLRLIRDSGLDVSASLLRLSRKVTTDAK